MSFLLLVLWALFRNRGQYKQHGGCMEGVCELFLSSELSLQLGIYIMIIFLNKSHATLVCWQLRVSSLSELVNALTR